MHLVGQKPKGHVVFSITHLETMLVSLTLTPYDNMPLSYCITLPHAHLHHMGSDLYECGYTVRLGVDFGASE